MQTRQGEGSTFAVTIPFEIASEKEGKGDSEEEEKESLKGIHLLLAEDNELNVEVARELLEERGAVVSTVPSLLRNAFFRQFVACVRSCGDGRVRYKSKQHRRLFGGFAVGFDDCDVCLCHKFQHLLSGIDRKNKNRAEKYGITRLYGHGCLRYACYFV